MRFLKRLLRNWVLDDACQPVMSTASAGMHDDDRTLTLRLHSAVNGRVMEVINPPDRNHNCKVSRYIIPEGAALTEIVATALVTSAMEAK